MNCIKLIQLKWTVAAQWLSNHPQFVLFNKLSDIGQEMFKQGFEQGRFYPNTAAVLDVLNNYHEMLKENDISEIPEADREKYLLEFAKTISKKIIDDEIKS